MKIIKTNNYSRDNVILIAENVDSFYGEIITNFLNKKSEGETSFDYFILIENDYSLNKDLESLT